MKSCLERNQAGTISSSQQRVVNYAVKAFWSKSGGDDGRSRPLGHDKAPYCATKEFKQTFNKGNPNFVELSFKDAYDETYLIDLLKPFIGTPEVIRTGGKYDKHFTPVSWCVADEVMRTAKYVCDHIEGGILPTNNWFKKKIPYHSRKTYDWEPKNGWGRFMYQAPTAGGILKIREILQQGHKNVNMWNREKVIKAYADFFLEYHRWPASKVSDTKIPDNEDAASFRRWSGYLAHNLSTRHVGSASEAKLAARLILPANQEMPAEIPLRSLPKGVSKNGSNKYSSRISINGKCTSLGTFHTIKEAEMVYLKALADKNQKCIGQ